MSVEVESKSKALLAEARRLFESTHWMHGSLATEKETWNPSKDEYDTKPGYCAVGALRLLAQRMFVADFDLEFLKTVDSSYMPRGEFGYSDWTEEWKQIQMEAEKLSDHFEGEESRAAYEFAVRDLAMTVNPEQYGYILAHHDREPSISECEGMIVSWNDGGRTLEQVLDGFDRAIEREETHGEPQPA